MSYRLKTLQEYWNYTVWKHFPCCLFCLSSGCVWSLQ